MKKIILAFLACAMFVAFASAKTLKIYKSTSKITIDGDKSDWSGTWQKIDQNKVSNTTTAIVSQFQLTYDNKYLYAIVEIKGDVTTGSDATAIPNTYERDCAEFYFSMDTLVRSDKSYYKGCWQIRKQRTPAESGAGIDGGAGGGNRILPTSFNMVSSGAGDPYYIEAAFAWDTLAQGFGQDTIKVWSGKMFKFDVQVADNSTGAASGRSQQIFWNENSDAQWNNTSKFGLITLNEPVTLDTRLKQYLNIGTIPAIRVGDADYQLPSSSSVNLPITYTSSNTSVATIVNNKIHVVSNGSCIITATQAGNSSYQPVSISFTLNVYIAGIPVNPKLTIPKVTLAPTIDGNKSDWSGNWINISNNKVTNTTNAITSKMQLAYDEKNLYVIVEVKGDYTPNNDATAIPNTYERDCIELFVSLDTITKSDYSYHEGVWQIRKQRTPAEFGKGIDGGTAGGANIWPSSFKIISSGNGDPYYVEAALPWDTLAQTMGKNGIPAWDRKQFKFDVQVADNTTGAQGGRTQQIFWNDNSDSQWNNTSKFGLVALQGVFVDTYEQVRLQARELELKVKNHQYVIKDTLHVTVIDMQQKSDVVKLSGGEVSISMYPNSAKKSINIDVSESIIQLELLATEGKLIKQLSVNALNSALDVSDINSGTYILKVITAKGVISSKLVLKK